MSATAFINGYRPFQFTDFAGGLNLRDKADAVGDREAIDLLNVDFAPRGAIRQRDGYVDIGSTDLTNRVDSLCAYTTTSGYHMLVAGCGTRLEAMDGDGFPIVSLTGLAGGPWQFARTGGELHEYLYAANGRDTVQRFDGAAWTSGAATAKVDGVTGRAMPKAGAICVTASDPGAASGSNASARLIATAFGDQTAAGPNGAATNPSRVYFSNPGLPEEWETDGDLGDVATDRPPRGRNFKDLSPGDGEYISAAIAWRELVFFFKQTKFFVYWGEGKDPDLGTPTFQVREVINGIGLDAPYAVAAGRDGVYFLNRHGVYRSSGGDPVLLSDVISPLWTQDPDVYFTSRPVSLMSLAQVRMLWHDERLYVAVPTGGFGVNDRVLVYDTQHQWWTLYDWPASAMTAFTQVDQADIHFGYSSGPHRLGRRALGATQDRGQPIRSYWRSGWSDYGSSQQRTLRETKVWGSGAVKVQFSVNFNRTLQTTVDTLFGTQLDWPITGTWSDWIATGVGLWPGGDEITDVLVRQAVRGTVFSTQFTNSPQVSTWSVHRIARHLREIREPSIR